MRPARLTFPILFAFAASLLSGCASREILRMDARYEKARLPHHFDREVDTNVSVFSVTAWRTQKEFAGWRDTSNGGLYGFSNAGYGVDLSMLGERGDVFFGGYLGASPDPGNLRVGGFIGTSPRAGRVVGTVSVGWGFNVSIVDAHYNDIEWGLFSPISETEDSVSGGFASVEVPFRAGLLFDLGDLSPYVNLALNYTAIGIEKKREPLLSAEGGIGVEYRWTPSLSLRAEAVASNTSIAERWIGPRYGARVELARSF